MKFSFDIRYSLLDILQFKKAFKCNALRVWAMNSQSGTVRILLSKSKFLQPVPQ